MKTRYIKYLALPLMLASAWSCTDMTEDAVNEATVGSTVKEIVLQLPELKTADTRTEFTVDEVNKTLKTAWAEGDVAGIFPTTGYNQVEFPISDAWGESVARFDGGDWALRANKSYAAYFPFNKANFERDASSIILSYEGQKQEYNGSVSHLSDYDYLATGAAQADAYGSIYFQMQRLSGILRLVFTLPADEAASFTKLVLLADEEVLDVKKSLDITGSIPQLGAVESSRSISMNLNNISADENHQLIVYMTLPPMSTNGQVKFNLMKDNGDLLIATSSGFSVEAGKVQGISISGFETMVNTTIEFEDNLVKAICVENWDMNGDGELGMAEAAIVTRLPNWQYSFNSYLSDTEITSFNELQYFTGLTSIADGAFDRCWYLESIVFPPSLLKIEHCAFRDCSSLTNVVFPESLTTIEGSAFESCVSLTEINLPASLTSLSNSFNGCSGVVSMTFGNSKYSLFDGTLIIEGNKTIGCLGNKTVVEIPDNITTIGESSFIICPNLKEVIIPNSVTIIDDHAFGGGHGVRDITIPESVTYIGSGCFAGSYMNSITINAKTPPTKEGDVFLNTNDCPIYVPASFVNAYKEAWTEYADRIYALGTKLLMNANLIAAAEAETGMQFVKNVDGKVMLNEDNMAIIEAVRSLNLHGKNDSTICDEIEYFTNIVDLDCVGNRLTSLDLSNNPSLEHLYCSENNLTSLNVSNNGALTTLQCATNQLTSLDVSHNPRLHELNCSNNQLSAINISIATSLEELYCSNNLINYLDFRYCLNLEVLDCSHNEIFDFGYYRNYNDYYPIETLICNDNQLTGTLDLRPMGGLRLLDCSNNMLTELKMPYEEDFDGGPNYNSYLEELYCSHNLLTSIDGLTDNNMLLSPYKLDCSYNRLEKMDANSNVLEYINISHNRISETSVWIASSLDISKDVFVGNQIDAQGKAIELKLYLNSYQLHQELSSSDNENVKKVLYIEES